MLKYPLSPLIWSPVFTDINVKNQLYKISPRLARSGTLTYYLNRITPKNHRQCLTIAKAAKKREKGAQWAMIAHLGASKKLGDTIIYDAQRQVILNLKL